jgi:dihydroxyacetone kinase-like predicted kinase
VLETPTLLPILRDAGVVDAGGRGLQLLLRGALGYLRDEHRPMIRHDAVELPSFESLADEGFGYETVYVVTPADGALLDPVAIRQHLDGLGDSVLVAGDGSAVKIHVHNERPDLVIAYGLSLGNLSRISVENLDRQAQARRQQADLPAPTAPSNGKGIDLPMSGFVPATTGHKPIDGLTVIAVAQGHGLARIFGQLGVTVVEGGQSANPSAGELAAAIRAAGTDEVIVLPNNPNVRMAAKQAGELMPDVRVGIVPTRNAAEGVVALLALDRASDGAANIGRMSKAAHSVQTLQVTTAVRDARIGRRRVKRGQHIVLDPDDGLLAADVDRTNALAAALAKLKPGFELLTLYYGQGVARSDAEQLAGELGPRLDGIEIELVDGGQPHYSFLIAAE